MFEKIITIPKVLRFSFGGCTEVSAVTGMNLYVSWKRRGYVSGHINLFGVFFSCTLHWGVIG